MRQKETGIREIRGDDVGGVLGGGRFVGGGLLLLRFRGLGLRVWCGGCLLLY